MRKTSLAVALAAILALVTGPAPSAVAASDVVLNDFESPDALTGATLPVPDADKASLTESFASEGRSSMRFDAGAFSSRSGKAFPRVWLNVGSTLPDVDWTQRTYLHVGQTNGSAERVRMYVVVWDTAGHNVLRSQWAEPFEHGVFEIKTADIAAAGVDMDQLDMIQISTERSPNPRRLYVDDIRLTDEATDVAAEKARVAPALIDLMHLRGSLVAVSRHLEKVRDRISPRPTAPDRALTAQAAAIEEQLDAYREQISSVGDDVAKARGIWSGLTDTGWRVKRLSSLVDARSARPAWPVGMAFADSATRVYPRDLPCACTYGRPELGMVRGEHESIQLVAAPYAMRLPGARVRAEVHGDPGGPRVGAHPVFSLDMRPPVEAHPASATAFRPSVYTGWTPDPIQTADPAVDVEAGDLQAFWVSLETTPDTTAGVYTVDLTLTADGMKPQRTSVRVRVWDVGIDQQPHLRTAIGHDPKAYAEPYGVTDPGEVAALVDQEYEFLGRYELQGDNIYRSVYEADPPSVASLRRIDERYGGLRQFNIWYFDPRLFDLSAPDTWAAQADALFDRIEPYVEEYRAAGFLDKGYLYCCDESRAEHTELISFVLTRFKERFPGIEVLATTLDDQMGRTTGLDRLIDRWVRDVPWYDREIVDERHAAGREAWWYLHVGNVNPTPNVFNNYDPGRMRTLLGPMAHQADIDGFLYYRVDRWYGHGIVDDGPFSDWDPRTFATRPGDGSLFYPGPDGPIPSIRLENIRDGLEDYNLLDALGEAIDGAPPGTDQQLIRRAKHLHGATDVVSNNYDYVDEPGPYRTWRADVAETIERLT